MIVLSSEGRTVFIGTLEKWKKGKGEAEDKLTIMSLKGLTMPVILQKKKRLQSYVGITSLTVHEN